MGCALASLSVAIRPVTIRTGKVEMLRFCFILSLFALVGGFAYGRDQTRAFKQVSWNGTDVAVSGGVATFRLDPEGCGAKTYGDGRGESDCNGGRRRSQLMAPKEVRVGQEVEYRLDLLVPASFRYDGDRGYPAYSRLSIAEWNRVKGIKNHVYEMLLDSVRGVTFERKVCFRPSEFGRWNTFSLKIRWSAAADGYLEARCNGRLVLERHSIQTVIPPDCGASYKLQCVPKLQKPGANLLWNVGPNLAGYGSDYRRMGRASPFPPFPPNGVEMQMRNLYVGRPI